MAHSLQGVYSPLPQSLSDSDSEKEICMEPICTNYVNSGIKHTKLENSGQNGHLGFNSINDDMLKIKRVNPKMSTLRKTAFVFSILLCFLPIIIFLWILPCSDSNTCPISVSNWEYQQDNIELQGEINLVHGAFQNSLNLAMMYKGSFNSQKILKNGIISFMGSSGAVAWDFQQESYPVEMNCSMIDVDGNGFNDCLVIDEKGLKAIETVSGEAVWHANSDQQKSIPQLDMPVKVEDFNKDGVNDLLSIYKKESFLLISGKTGKALSNMKLAHLCTSISNLTLINFAIRYGCMIEQQTIKTFEISFSNLEKKYSSNEQLNPREVMNTTQLIYETGMIILKKYIRSFLTQFLTSIMTMFFKKKQICIKSINIRVYEYLISCLMTLNVFAIIHVIKGNLKFVYQIKTSCSFLRICKDISKTFFVL